MVRSRAFRRIAQSVAVSLVFNKEAVYMIIVTREQWRRKLFLLKMVYFTL